MKLIIKTAATAAIAAIGLIGTAAGANAAVIDNGNGSVHVDKGDVQASSAFKWNNAAFDANQKNLTFSLSGEFKQVQHFNGAVNGVEYHGTLVTTGNRIGGTNETELLSANGKQVWGWDLSPTQGTISGGSTQYPGSLNREYNAYQMAVLLGGNVTEKGHFSQTIEGKTDSVTAKLSTTGESHVLPITPVL